MTKSTKRPLPVSKTIQFQQHQKIKDISVSGKDALTSVDFSERDGDFKLKVKADPDKLNEVTGTPFVTTSVTTADEGTDDPKKSVTLGHDYRGLNVETAGKYLSINKTKDKAVIDGTLIEADLTKALNDAKEAKDKADKTAEKAGLADQKATTAITQIADVKDALAKLSKASTTEDAKLWNEIGKLKAKLKTLPEDAKLYVSEADKERANSGRLEGLTYVDFYTSLDSTDATAISVSENITISVTLKPDAESTSGTAFTREVSEIRLEVVQPAVKDWTEEFQTLTVNLEDTQARAQMANTKAEEAKQKADSLETTFNNVSKNLQDHAMDEAQLNSLTAKLETTTTTANTAKESADTATALAQQAKATADKTATDLGLAQAKEIADIKNVTDTVERLRTAFGQQNGKLQGRLSELAQKIEKANAGATAPEPLKVNDATYNAIKAYESNPHQLVTSATFIVNGQSVTLEVGDLNEVANFDTSIEGRVLTENPRSNVSGTSNSLIIGLKGDTHEVQSIKIDSGHRDIEKRLLGVRDWLNFVPTKAEKALLQLSQAGGRTNFTQEQVDQGIIVSEGLMVDMGKYWLPVGNVELAFGGDKPSAQELLDFTIYTYDLDTARVNHINAKTLLEPDTKCPPILKTVY
ncbi:MAG: hypothetical protein [Bacteriophage sp.]|nr:MAG: hypothetical protein [Bacteriophage sp.]